MKLHDFASSEYGVPIYIVDVVSVRVLGVWPQLLWCVLGSDEELFDLWVK